MKINHKDIKSWVILCVLLTALVGSSRLMAQSPYFEAIGGTDVELMAFLENQKSEQSVQRNGERIEVKSENLRIIYTLRKGKVISIDFNQYFSNYEEAIKVYNQSISFLYSRGVSMRQVKDQDNYRIVRGMGSGVEADMTVMPSGKRFRLDAELLVIN